MKSDSQIRNSALSSEIWDGFLRDIKSLCLSRNFGTLSKSEFEILLFHYFLADKCSQAKGKYVSDYELGRDLGLTIQRVRSLREREGLKWGISVDWKDAFLSSLKNARCDQNGNVKIPIADVNVIKEIRNYLEMQGLYDDYQLNPRIFQCSLDVLVSICLCVKSDGQDEFGKKILGELRNNKDGRIARAIDGQERPILSSVSKAALKSVKDSISLIPGIGGACSELLDSIFEAARKN